MNGGLAVDVSPIVCDLVALARSVHYLCAERDHCSDGICMYTRPSLVALILSGI